MIEARVLPQGEWNKLEISKIPPMWMALRPEDAQMIVIEDEGRVIAMLGTLRITHFENLWIDPEYRGNPNVARKLMRKGLEAARKWATDWAIGYSGSDHMNDILERVGGVKMPVDTYIVPISGS